MDVTTEILAHRDRVREHLAKQGESVVGVSQSRYLEHVDVLLERVGELEAQVEKLKNVNAGNVRLDDRVWELEAENEELKLKLQVATDYQEALKANKRPTS